MKKLIPLLAVLSVPAFAKPLPQPHFRCRVIETGKMPSGLLKGTDTETELAMIPVFVEDDSHPDGSVAKPVLVHDHEFTATWTVNMEDRKKGTQSLAVNMDDKPVFYTEFNRRENRDVYLAFPSPNLRVDCNP